MNDSIFFLFYNLAHKSGIFDKLVVFFAVYFPYMVIFLAGVFLLMHHEVFKAESPFQVFMQKKKEILLVFFGAGLARLITEVFKITLHTSRPFDLWSQVQSLFPQTGYAFPSGHAAIFMALAFSIFFMHKKAGYYFMAFAFLIGIARIIAGVHFPVDILGGFILGGLVAFGCHSFYLSISKSDVQ